MKVKGGEADDQLTYGLAGLAAPVNVFGRVIGDARVLGQVKAGAEIKVTKEIKVIKGE